MNRNKAKQMKERVHNKKELQIDAMSNEEVVNELKEKKLPTFGTAQERKERLKKHYGLQVAITPQSNQNDSTLKDGTNNVIVHNAAASKKSSCLEEIERLKQNREERRKKMDDLRKLKTEREQFNEAQGIKVDVDFQVMVEQHMKNIQQMQPHIPADQLKICVCVKKRPIFANELSGGEIDCVSVSNPYITVHECKYKVDGITKFVDNSEFQFDNSFSHQESNEELYYYSIRPILDLAFNQGIVTVFAYGQTGSGKTFTMQGLQESAIRDLFDRGITYFQEYQRNYTVTISMFEIYGGKVYDLLNNHEQLKVLEDKSQKIQIQGLKEQFVQSEEEILNLISFGNSVRTTHATKANDTSSRSHAICQIKIHEEGVKNPGRLLLVDLAGSERAQDCQSNNKDRQQEGAEINKSLLALKECIRALDQQKGQAAQGQHVPFRASKLTMVLRDSFIQSEKNKIVMLACVCPGSSSADHTLNTLRYAERLKERSNVTPAHHNVQNQVPNYQSTIEDQMKAFKKQSSQKYITNDQPQKEEFQPSMKKGQTVVPQPQQQQPKLKEITRDSNLGKPNKDMFYHNNKQNTNNNNNRSFSDYGQEDQTNIENEDTGMVLDDPTPVQHFQPKQQQMMKQHESPQQPINKMFNKVGVQSQYQQQVQQKHNFQQSKLQQAKQTSVQHKFQQQQHKFAQQKKQDDSFVSDEGFGSDMKNMSPRSRLPVPHQNNPSNNLIMPKKIQDSNYPEQQHQNLKMQTPPKPNNFNFNNQQQQEDEDMFGEDDRIAAEENILNGHLECVKEEAQLITQEGELITKIEKSMVNDANYDMRGYLDMAECIARKKLEMYSKLLNDISDFRGRFGNEL